MKHLATIKIRDRGIITLPSEVRKMMKIKDGDEIALVLNKGEIIIKKPKREYENFDVD